MEINHKDIESMECPDTKTLAEFMSGNVSEPENNRMKAHLAICDNCLEIIAMSAQIIKEAESSVYEPISRDTADAVIRRMQKRRPASAIRNGGGVLTLIQNFFKSIIHMIMPMQPVFQRSVSDGRSASGPLIKKFDDFQVIISADIQETSSADITVTLSGTIQNIIRLTLENTDMTYDDSRPVRGNSEQFYQLAFDGYRLSINLKESREYLFVFRLDDKGIHEA